jgi:hypothetical protein
MKRCPKCESTFTDIGLNFCVSDGTPLIETPRYDSEAETLKNYPPSARPKLVVTATTRFKTDVTYPLKLYLDVANTEREPVAIESISFELSNSFRLQPNVNTLPGTTNQYRPRFRVWQTLNSDGKKVDHYKDRCILEPNETTIAFVPIDPAIGSDALTAAINGKTVGVWRYRCAWFGEQVVSRDYEERF